MLMQTVGKNIRHQRMVNKMTQSALAEKMKISRQAVNSVESGRVDISVTRLEEYSKALGVSPTKLTKGEK